MNMLINLMVCEATASPISERLADALLMLVVGLGAVFAVLTIIWGVLALTRVLLNGTSSSSKSTPHPPKPVVSAPSAPVVQKATVTPCPTAQQDNGALIAVITAALSAAMAEEGTLPPGGFRVVSFRRASDARAWNRK